PRQNRHRRADGWQHATVRAILDNPKYTGYAIYGRWQKVEELLDPDDVAAGHVVKFRRSPQSKVVRSREPAHPTIVTVEDFTRVQLAMRARAGGGRRSWSALERTRVSSKRTYVLRGLLRCSLCGRKMEGSARKHAVLYRCSARTLVPGSELATSHPPHVYLREDHVCRALNGWISRLFAAEHRDATIAVLADADDTGRRTGEHLQAVRQRVATAESTMRRLQRALEAGWDPESMREQYNAAAAEKRSAEADLAAVPEQRGISRDELRAVVDAIGDMTGVINKAEPQDLADLYQALRLTMTYDHAAKMVEATMRPIPCVDKSGVRGGT
ncbi:MAG: recombinase family protein, partial [Micromonosporaceae bacterium]